MRRLLPHFDPADLDDRALTTLYAPPDRSTPRVRINFVTSTDGAVAVESFSAGLSSPPDKRVFSLLRELCDTVMVGAGTLRHESYGALRLDSEQVSRRREAGLADQPTLVIVSSRLELSPEHRMLTDAPTRPIVLTHTAAPADRRAALESVADVVTCGDDTVDLPAGLAALAARGLTQVLCEGGPHLFGALTAADAVDEFCLTISPLIAGPGAGRIIAGAPLPEPRGLTLAHLLEEDGTLLLRYTRP